MEDVFQRIATNSTLARPSFNSGHTYELPLPCTVHGLYNARTGTIILEHVWCDGNSYSLAELSADERERFYDKLRLEVLFESEF